MRTVGFAPRDILASILASIIALLVVLFIPGSALQFMGLAALLMLLGYALTTALFPGENDISPLWRAVLNLGISLSAAAMLFISQRISTHAEGIETIAGVISAFVFFLTGLAYLRRMDPPRSERSSFQGGYQRACTSRRAAERIHEITALILIALLVGSALALAHLSSQRAVDGKDQPKNASIGTEERMISSAQASLSEGSLNMGLSSTSNNISASDSIDRPKVVSLRYGSPGSDKKEFLYPRSNLTAAQIALSSQETSNASPAAGAAKNASGNASRNTSGIAARNSIQEMAAEVNLLALPAVTSSTTKDMNKTTSNQSSDESFLEGSQSSAPIGIAPTELISDGSSLPYQEIDLTDQARGSSTSDISKLGMGDSVQKALASSGGSKEGSSSSSGSDSSIRSMGTDTSISVDGLSSDDLERGSGSRQTAKWKDASKVLKDISKRSQASKISKGESKFKGYQRLLKDT